MKVVSCHQTGCETCAVKEIVLQNVGRCPTWWPPCQMYTDCTSIGDGQTSCKVWLASVERRRCSNESKTRNPLKFAAVPQITEPISAANGPKFAILCGHVEEILLFKNFFPLSIHALVAKIQPDIFVRWCADGDLCVIFASCISSEPHAAHFRPAFWIRTKATPCVEVR